MEEIEKKKEKKFAVLIDADNIADKYIKIVLDETANSGIATYKRIYGDWTAPGLGSWKQVLLNNSIIPIQQYSYTFGKNSTDSAMIIDAMDILYSGTVDGFCLVSSDSDFTRLAARLRESGMYVIGMGESKTPKPFISACNQFKYLDILFSNNVQKVIEPEEKKQAAGLKKNRQQEEIEKTSEREKAAKLSARNGKKIGSQPQFGLKTIQETMPQPQTSLKVIQEAICNIIEESTDESEWMFSAELKNKLDKRYPDFDVRNFGFSKFTPFIASFDNIEVKKEKTNNYNNAQLVYFKLK